MQKPRAFYFNPTCELAIANGSFSYMPPLLLQEMERDLAALLFIFATENDYVITENPPSDLFIQQLKDWGFNVPRFSTLADLEKFPANSFDSIYPWGWSPAAHFKLKNLKEKCSEEFKSSPAYNWQQTHQLLFERSTALNFLSTILTDYPQSWFIQQSLTGVVVTSIEEIENLIKTPQTFVLKAPLSSSGRGIQVIRKKNLNNSNKAWISGVLKQQHYLIAEPYLDKLADLSFQFRINENADIDYLGLTFFETNSNGQYKGSFIHVGIADIFPDENIDELEVMLTRTAKIIGQALKSSVYTSLHRGYLGVDAMVFRENKRVMIQPCIEINCRMNMGILTILLQKYIHLEVKGKFELYFGEKGEFEFFAEKQKVLNPPLFFGGKIRSGFFQLVEPNLHQKFGAYFFVSGTK